MLVLAVLGTSQEPFESVMTPVAYAELLLLAPTQLRVVFALDDLFLLSYASLFVAYYVARRGHADPVLLRLALGGVLVAAVLDAIENFHVRAMLSAVEAGGLPSRGEIELQYVMSAVKFTVGYFAAICFAITYPRDTALARMVGLSTGVVFPILGVLVFAAPPEHTHVLVLARVTFFVSGYALSALVFWPRARGRGR